MSLLFSNVRVLNNLATVDLVFSAPKGTLSEKLANELSENMVSSAKEDLPPRLRQDQDQCDSNQINKFSGSSELPSRQ